MGSEMFVVCIHGRSIPGDPERKPEECLDCEETGALVWLESITRRPWPVTDQAAFARLDDIRDAHSRIDAVRARRTVLPAVTPENAKRPGP